MTPQPTDAPRLEGRPFRKRRLIAAGIAVVLAIVAAVVLRPYYAMPPESRDELMALLAECRATAAAVAARPIEDRAAFEKMLSNMAVLLDTPIDWREDACPPRQFTRTPLHEAKLRALPGFDRRLEDIVDGGFVLQQDLGVDAEMFGVPPFQNWLRLELLLAAQEARGDDPGAAVARLGRLLTVTEGVLQTPYLFYAMTGMTFEREIDATALHVLPRLAEDDLTALRARLAGRADPVYGVLDAMKTDLAYMVEAVSNTIPEPLAESGVGRALWNLAGAVGYRDREILTYISFSAGEAANFRAWYEAGGAGAPPSDVHDRARHSFLVSIGWPNYERVVTLATEQVAARQAVLATIDAELSHRRHGTPRPVRTTFAERRHVQSGDDCYCLIEDTQDEPEFY